MQRKERFARHVDGRSSPLRRNGNIAVGLGVVSRRNKELDGFGADLGKG